MVCFLFCTKVALLLHCEYRMENTKYKCGGHVMAYKEFNPNPNGKHVGDCVIRAISKVTGNSWERTYIELCLQGFMMSDMPSANHVWGNYLKGKGYKQVLLQDDCSDCFTVKDFCNEYISGTYVLATGSHVIAVEDGDYYDAWDSGDEVPVYYWEKKEG